MYYVIRAHISDPTIVESVAYADARERIDTLSGRAIGAYILRQIDASARRGKRASAYVAAARGSEWRAGSGSAGFSVELIRESAG